MEKHWPAIRETLVLIACAAFCALVAGFFLHAPMRTSEFWLGDKGWLEVAAPIGAVVAASVAAAMSLRTYRFTQQKDLGERFKTGIEMLESANPTKRGGGLIILEDLALTSKGGRHANWVSEIIKNSIEDWSRSEIHALPPSTSWGSLTFPPTAVSTLRGFFAFLEVTKGQQRLITGLYLAERRIEERDLTDLNLVWAVIAGVDFVRCEMRGTTITRRIYDSLGIEDCDFTRGTLRLGPASECDVDVVDTDCSGAFFFVPVTSRLTLRRCQIDGCRIRGRGSVVLENCWFRIDEPDLDDATLAALPKPTLYRSSDSGNRFTTNRGWSGWSPSSGDKPIDLSGI